MNLNKFNRTSTAAENKPTNMPISSRRNNRASSSSAISNNYNAGEDEYYDTTVINSNNNNSSNNNISNANNSDYISEARRPEQTDQTFNENNSTGGQGVSPAMAECTPLAICQVIYIGARAPEPGTTGLQAVQMPLTHLYRSSDLSFLNMCTQSQHGSSNSSASSSSFVNEIIKNGVEATLAVYSFGLKLIYLPADNSPVVNLWFPISNLFVCAAVRAVKSMPSSARFVPLDLSEADESNEAPLFAAIFRQSRARHLSECFCFKCKSKENAMDLVIACTKAFEAYVRSKPAQPTTGLPSSLSSSIPHLHLHNNINNDPSQGLYESQTLFGSDISAANNLQRSEPLGESNEEAEEEKWQPILVRRVWLPGAVPPPPSSAQCYYGHVAASSLKQRLPRRKKWGTIDSKAAKRLLHQQQQQQSCGPHHPVYLAPHHYRMAPPGHMLRWPSVDAVLASKHPVMYIPPASNDAHSSTLLTSTSSSSKIRRSTDDTARRLFETNSANRPMSSSKIMSHSAADLLRSRHRQWSSQPDLVVRAAGSEVSRWPGSSAAQASVDQSMKENRRGLIQHHHLQSSTSSNSFVSRVCNFIFAHKRTDQQSTINNEAHRIIHQPQFSSSSSSLSAVSMNNGNGAGAKKKKPVVGKFNSNQRRINGKGNNMVAMNASHQGVYNRNSNGSIDYATVASDEADLLAVQADCYGAVVTSNNNNNNTLTRLPLPNERAFMISIQNQQQQRTKVQPNKKQPVSRSNAAVIHDSSAWNVNSKDSDQVSANNSMQDIPKRNQNQQQQLRRNNAATSLMTDNKSPSNNNERTSWLGNEDGGRAEITLDAEYCNSQKRRELLADNNNYTISASATDFGHYQRGRKSGDVESTLKVASRQEDAHKKDGNLSSSIVFATAKLRSHCESLIAKTSAPGTTKFDNACRVSTTPKC